MTTLAWDGKVLASDSQCTQQEMVMLSDHQKIFTPEPHQYWEIQGQKVLAFGICGDSQSLPYILEELEKGVTHKTRFNVDKLDFLVMAVTEQGVCWYWGVDIDPRRQHQINILSPNSGPCSAGSGQTIAHAVMGVTGDAVQAIVQAIRLDIYSGGDVQAWEFPGVPEVFSKRPVAQPAQPLSSEQIAALLEQIKDQTRQDLAGKLDHDPAVQELIAAVKEKEHAQ